MRTFATIVERLRYAAGVGDPASEVLAEAAAEIERLRAALVRIANAEKNPIIIARRALEEK